MANTKLQILIDEISNLELDDKVQAINEIKQALHEISPFKNEPVDCVIWVKNTEIVANDYNPNSVAPPEMKLLETSIVEDGYTQPIVTFPREDAIEVVDGFHRNRVGKESTEIQKRVLGYLPIVKIKPSQEGVDNRMAATIRHNRARGKHRVNSMSEIVLELKRRNWSDKKIADKIGMDQDEILRLTQIGGIAECFADHEFTQSWEAEKEIFLEDVE